MLFMNGRRIIKKINKRIGGSGFNFPTDPLEFQKLIHNNFEIFFSNNFFWKINYDAEIGRSELDSLLKEYCLSCKIKKFCSWNKEVEKSRENNHFYWFPTWQVVGFYDNNNDSLSNFETVMCAYYQSEKFEKRGIDKLEHPLFRLGELFESNGRR